MAEEKQERTEYRVLGTDRRTGHNWEGTPHAKRPEDYDLSSLRSRSDNIRIQKRTVTETPWEDVADE